MPIGLINFEEETGETNVLDPRSSENKVVVMGGEVTAAARGVGMVEEISQRRGLYSRKSPQYTS
jgi:hypothetical protein